MIPERILKGLMNYRDKRQPVGSFLTAVLTNDLMTAVGKADAESFAALKEICAWVYWELPAKAWRTPEKVKAWLDEAAALPDTDPEINLPSPGTLPAEFPAMDVGGES